MERQLNRHLEPEDRRDVRGLEYVEQPFSRVPSADVSSHPKLFAPGLYLANLLLSLALDNLDKRSVDVRQPANSIALFEFTWPNLKVHVCAGLAGFTISIDIVTLTSLC
jgi:hypothetical protein